MTTYKGVDPYATVRERLNSLFRQTESLLALFDGVCAALTATLPHYTWAGIYLVEGDELVLAAWCGPAPTRHVRIPVGEGICGYAAATGESIIVPDVARNPRYLECFAETRAEIVVPIIAGDRVLGEIDVDANHLNAFGAADQELLEEVARRLADVMVKADRA
ncbi:MAG: GAF domain-containing protein [Sphaerobacter sp.]|nr:GAF domain-containing protein [Sphaerobacter sp.]